MIEIVCRIINELNFWDVLVSRGHFLRVTRIMPTVGDGMPIDEIKYQCAEKIGELLKFTDEEIGKDLASQKEKLKCE